MGDLQDNQLQQATQPNVSEDENAKAFFDFQNGIAKTSIDRPISSEIQTYLETLIKTAQIPVYDEETKKQVVRELFIRFDKFLSLKIMERLTQDNMKTFLQMLEDKKTPEEMNNFLLSCLPQVDDIIANAFIDFRDFYLTAQDNFSQMQQAGNPR